MQGLMQSLPYLIHFHSYFIFLSHLLRVIVAVGLLDGGTDYCSGALD